MIRVDFDGDASGLPFPLKTVFEAPEEYVSYALRVQEHLSEASLADAQRYLAEGDEAAAKESLRIHRAAEAQRRALRTVADSLTLESGGAFKEWEREALRVARDRLKQVRAAMGALWAETGGDLPIERNAEAERLLSALSDAVRVYRLAFGARTN